MKAGGVEDVDEEMRECGGCILTPDRIPAEAGTTKHALDWVVAIGA
jgi:hypothetical protein